MPISASVLTAVYKFDVWSDALWNVTFVLPPHSIATNYISLVSTRNYVPCFSSPPTTTPCTLNRSLSYTMSSMSRLISYLECTNPLLWCLTMTCVGIDAAYNDLRTMAPDGVTPPIYSALTNSMRSPPLASMVAESRGLEDMTYRRMPFCERIVCVITILK